MDSEQLEKWESGQLEKVDSWTVGESGQLEKWSPWSPKVDSGEMEQKVDSWLVNLC